MMEKNQIFENIMSRTSVRSYTDMPVEPEKVEMMLRAGWQLHRLATSSLGILWLSTTERFSTRYHSSVLMPAW